MIISRHRMFDSFVHTDMLEKLREHKIRKVVLAGLVREDLGSKARAEGFGSA